MTANQLKVTLSSLGFNQVEAARLLGYDTTGRVVRRWVAGELPVPATVSALLRLMVEGKITADDIKRTCK